VATLGQKVAKPPIHHGVIEFLSTILMSKSSSRCVAAIDYQAIGSTVKPRAKVPRKPRIIMM
jgi:hypothetical protein